jgi:hypothetical protein
MENEIRTDPGPAFEGEDSILRNLPRLFFRPGSYFARIAAPKKHFWLFLFAFTYSVAYAIDRSGFNSAQGKAPAGSWAVHWAIIGGSAIFGSLIVLSIGGWWYRKRLGYCGVHDADKDLAKLVYLSAAQVYALPMIVVALAESLLYKDPVAAGIRSPAWLSWGMFVFVFWSLYASYVGVRTVFKPKRAAAAFWFLGGPAALYILIFAGMFGLAMSGSAFLPGPDADIAHPKEYSAGGMAFSYPGNWVLMEVDETPEASAQVQVRPIQDAVVILSYFEPQGSAADHLAGWSEAMIEEFKDGKETGSLGAWGELVGEGCVVTGRKTGKEIEARGFIAPLSEDRYLMVLEVYQRSALDKVQPGFDLIRGSFRCLWD